MACSPKLLNMTAAEILADVFVLEQRTGVTLPVTPRAVTGRYCASMRGGLWRVVSNSPLQHPPNPSSAHRRLGDELMDG